MHFFHYGLIVVLVLPHVESDSYISVVTTKEAAAYSKRRNSKSTFVENLPYRSSSSFFLPSNRIKKNPSSHFKLILVHVLWLEWSGFFFPHEVCREWILLHQVHKDVSLRRLHQTFVKMSLSCQYDVAKWIWETLTMCKSWLKLLGLSWLVAELACWLSLWYEGMMRKLFYMGENGNGRNWAPSVQNPQWVFSWCGYDLKIFFQNTLFCTNLLKQLYIHFWRTILKKNKREKAQWTWLNFVYIKFFSEFQM